MANIYSCYRYYRTAIIKNMTYCSVPLLIVVIPVVQKRFKTFQSSQLQLSLLISYAYRSWTILTFTQKSSV